MLTESPDRQPVEPTHFALSHIVGALARRGYVAGQKTGAGD